jgi:hypothetical protein
MAANQATQSPLWGIVRDARSVVLFSQIGLALLPALQEGAGEVGKLCVSAQEPRFYSGHDWLQIIHKP